MIMELIGGLALILCGVLCMPDLILKKRPNAQEILAKIAPYRGFIGIVICALGILSVIFWLISTAFFFNQGFRGFILWVTEIASSALSMLVGFLLGFELMKRFVPKNAPEGAQDKIEDLHERLEGVQVPLGIAAVIAGGWSILYSIIYYFI
jgi:hypothetical protein